MKKAIWGATAAAAFLACASTAQAQNATASIQATVNVGNQARLTVTGNISFADSDPDTVINVPASAAVSISARARVAPSQALVVTVVADNAFVDNETSTNTIPVGALSWTATGTNFQGGTVNTSAVNVASWSGPSNQAGTQSYSLLNSWNYAPGAHVVTLTYTLTTP